jgi:hypothetical protein
MPRRTDPTRHYIGTMPTLPSDAWGFIAPRRDRPERLALYSRAGLLRTTFANGQTVTDAARLIVSTYPGASAGPETVTGYATVWNIPAE